MTRIILCGLAAASLAVAGSLPAHAQHHHHGAENTSGGTYPFSLTYHYMRMHMGGLRDGTDDVSVNEAVAMGYTMIPTIMDMHMHRLTAGYAVNDWFDVSLSGQYHSKYMEMVHWGHHVHFNRHRVTGIGDTEVAAGLRVYNSGDQSVRIGMGLSLPTGSIDEGGVHGDPNVLHGYEMQLGTGTYDLLPSVNWRVQKGKFDYGAGVAARVHLGENDNGYSRGDSLSLSVHAGYAPFAWLYVDAGLRGKVEGDVDGRDPRVTTMSPTGDPDHVGGTTLAANIGLCLIPQDTPGSAHNFRLDVGTPLYQDLNGPQMEDDWSVGITWTGRF